MSAGSVAVGLFDGLLIGLLAVGLVLVYRANKFLNLAHSQLGAVPALLLAKLVVELGWPYWVALPIALSIGIGSAIAVERLLVARLRRKGGSSVTLLLLTLGIAQLLLVFTFLPIVVPDAGRLSTSGYPLPVHWTWTFDGIKFGGQYIVAAFVCPVAIAGLALFLRYSLLGKLIRATASNPQAARTCGISPTLVSGVVWGIAGALATVSAILSAPTAGIPTAGGFAATQLLLALGAAACGSFVSIPLALGGALLLGVVNAIVIGETGNAGTGRLVVFVVILGVILVRGRSLGRVFAVKGMTLDAGDAPAPTVATGTGWLAGHPIRALAGGGVVLAGVAPFLPYFNAPGQRFQLTLILIYALVGVSLTMLIGWGGQLSMGHMAIVGVGAFIAARLAAQSYSLVSISVIAGLAGAGICVLIGLPALRVRGLTLAVSTLGFAVVASEHLFRSEWFTTSRGRAVAMPPVEVLRGAVPVDSRLSAYVVALGGLILVLLAASGLRRSTPGRHIVAVRDDEDAIACLGVSPMSIKLLTLMISGWFAAFAGVVWALAWQTVTPDQFPPAMSLTVLAVPVIGGLGSLSGAVIGAMVLYLPAYFLTDPLSPILGTSGASAAVQLLVGGLGLVVTLLRYPSGIAGAVQRRWNRYVASSRQAQPVGNDEPAREPISRKPGRAPRARFELAPDALPLRIRALSVRFDGVRALAGADIEVRNGEILGLIGPNGAGKSTLINAVSGTIRPAEGGVELDGREISGLAPEVRAALGLGRSFQSATLFPGLTVQESVEAVVGAGWRIGVVGSMVRAPWAERSERLIAQRGGELIERFGLSPYRTTLTANLSTGTRRICDLALQVAHEPTVLLLDEPTGGVAQREAEAFGPLLRTIRDELDCSIVIVEHDMPLLMGLCDRIYAMDQGRVIAEGTPEAIRNDPLVIASYLGTDDVVIERSGTGAATTPARRGRRPLAAKEKA